jgi:hypothetical protein
MNAKSWGFLGVKRRPQPHGRKWLGPVQGTANEQDTGGPSRKLRDGISVKICKWCGRFGTYVTFALFAFEPIPPAADATLETS